MHATLPLLARTDFPALERRHLRTLQVNLGYKCNQSCLHCHVNAGPHRTEMMDGDTVDLVARRVQSARHRDAGPDRRRARAESAFPPPGRCGARARRARHRPLQPDDPVRARTRKTWPRFSPRERRRGGGVAAVLSVGQRRPPARRRRLRHEHRGAAASSTRSATGRPDGGLVLNLVYNPQGPSLPPAQDRLEADYKRELGSALRHRVQRLYRAGQHADPALRQHAGLARASSPATCSCCGRLPRREPRHRDVPRRSSASTGRVTSTTATSTRCSACRSRLRARRARICATCCERGIDRRTDARRRPLLRLHRGPGQQLRRRAAGAVTEAARPRR